MNSRLNAPFCTGNPPPPGISSQSMATRWTVCDDYRVSMALEELEHENPQDRASDR